MNILKKAYEKVKKAFSKSEAGGTKQDCPLKESGLLVVVLRESDRAPVKNALVLIQGATSATKKTGKDGIAFYKPVDPGSYTINVTLPSDIARDYVKPDAATQAVAEGSCPIKVIHAEQLAALKVHVYHKDEPAKGVGGTNIEIPAGAQALSARKTNDGDGIADFGKTKAGKYTIRATLKESVEKNFTLVFHTKDVTLKPGKETVVPLEVVQHVVTPKIEMEYKVVLLNPKLPDPDSAIKTDPTYIVVSAEQSRKSNPFKGTGKLKCSPANVEAFLDEACTKKLPGNLAGGADLSNAQITGAKGLKIYFKGKTAGQFDVSLELVASKTDTVRVEKPVQGKGKHKMGVVRLEMKLHRQDIVEIEKLEVDPDTDPVDNYYTNLKNKALPEQKEMTDEEKVKQGRLLHVQKDGNFGRAKLVCKKLVAGQWPAGTDDYEIVLAQENKSGSLEAFDKESEGTLKALPVKVKVSDAKTKDQTWWIQGKTATNKLREARLHLGIDRAKGGLAKKPKNNGDWARLSVVEIKEVKVDYKPTRKKPIKYDISKHRFYINQGATWDGTNKKFTTDANTDANGRKVVIGAQLSQAIKDVTVYFMLAPDKNNRKAANWGKDMPATWKWKDIDSKVKHLDKTGRKKILHLSAKTDDKGYAKAELTLSRFGGDVFWPACYIDEDPHLAKFVDGHADLEKRKPVKASHSVAVWRKFWYQEVKVAGLNVAGFGDAARTYEDVKAEMLASPAVEMTKVKANTISPKVIYKKHMVSFYLNNTRTAYVNNYPGDNGEALVVGDDNRSEFFKLAKPESDKPVAIPMLNAHALWVKDGLTSTATIPFFNATGFPKRFSASKKLLDPPLQGGTLLKTGSWEAWDWDPAANHGAGAWGNRRTGNLSAGDVELDSNRSDPRYVNIKKPAGIVVAATGTRVKITNLTLRAGVYYLGTSYADGIVNAYTPNDQQDFINTINHEVGHSFKQVTKVRPAGIPAHPHQYDRQGSHCNYTNKSCLMYESGPQPASLNRYCPVCHPYVLVQDMSKAK